MNQNADSDRTAGQFTTVKLQALLDSGTHPDVRNRRDLAVALKGFGARISVHGVEAWFRRVDSNYNHARESLSVNQPSYALPSRHWPLLLEMFDLTPVDLALNDTEFGQFCLARNRPVEDQPLVPLDKTAPEHLPGRALLFTEIVAELQAGATDEFDCARLILLEGAAGMGKSSLLKELVQRIRGSGGLCVTASCAENTFIPLLPLLDFVRLQIDEVARGGADAIRLAEELVGRIERANQKDEYGESESGATSDKTLFLLGSDLLATLARKAPLVVVLDDVHWIDDATRDLLVHFATFLRLNRQHRVVLLLASREFNSQLLHKLPTGEFTRRFELQPLDRKAMRQATLRLLDNPLGPQARDYIWNISEGNPLYVEQLAQHLVASNQLQPVNGLLELIAPADAVSVPDGLTEYYRQHYVQLDTESSHLLLLAACVGQQISNEFLQLLVPGATTEDVLAALDRAETAGLLRFVRNAYEFCHPVARHAVYTAVSVAERARQHAKIANAIDSSSLNRSPHASIEFAYHLLRGRPHSVAATTLVACKEAAEHSHRLSAWPSTEYFSTAALTLDDENGGLTDDQRGKLLRLRGSSRHQTARPEVALQDLEEALTRFQSDQNTSEYVRTLTQVVRIRANFSQVREGRNEAAEELGGFIEHLSEADRSLAASALEVLAGYRLANNDSQTALKLAERVIDEFGEVVEPERYVLSRITAGASALNHLDGQVGLAHLLEATSFARSNGHAPSLDRALQRLVYAQILLGRMNDVAATYEEIRRLSKGTTITGEYSTVLAAVSAADAVRGDFSEALNLIDDALELVDVSGYRFMETTLVGIQAYCYSRLGQHPEAFTAIDRLERDRPRRGARLLRQCVALFEPLTKGGVPCFSEEERQSALDSRTPDIGELARVIMLGQCALANNDVDVLEGALLKLRAAESSGLVFAIAWPVQLPLLMGRICLRLGQERDAHYFLRRSMDHARAHGLSSQLRDLQDVLLAEWPEERELIAAVEVALSAEPDSKTGLPRLV